MNEQPEKVWKKSWKGWSWLIAWLILVVITMLIVVVINQLIVGPAPVHDAMIVGTVIGAVVATLSVGPGHAHRARLRRGRLARPA
jgi:hypothetical protein